MVKEKISNVFLAFKFAILDHSYSKSEILEIINNNALLLKAVQRSSLGDGELENLIDTHSSNGSFIDANKILMELLRKKIVRRDPGYLQTLKTLETMLWVGGLEKQKISEIDGIIYIHEVIEHHKLSEDLINKIRECVTGFEDYDITTYLNNN